MKKSIDPSATEPSFWGQERLVPSSNPSIDQLCINAIRALSIDAVQKANSGHPGLPLGAAPMSYVLWQRHLNFDPSNPDWSDRDRFILSPGHGSILLYALLHLYGYEVSRDDLKNFRQWESKTPGHPEFGVTAGVEATTGPLGQGTANAVGMAIAERMLAQRFHRDGQDIVDHFTYALVSDGDLMEGISAEAASLAGHCKLGKLIYLYDSNDVSLDGPTSMTFTEDVARRYEACGWHVQTVVDGDHDLDAIDAAIAAAKADTERPSLIVVKTTIGFGSPNKAGTCDAHGAPLGVEEVALTKRALGWSEEPFEVPAAVRDHCREGFQRGVELHQAWEKRFAKWKQGNEAQAGQWAQAWSGELPAGWDAELPAFEPGSQVATRSAGGKVLNALAKNVETLVGGDADLSCSTKTLLSDAGSFDGQSGAGRNVHFGVREHAMGAIANGMSLHGGVRPFTGTFFCFSDYMRPSVRLAALSELPVVHVWTHDSIGVGEDGPTHQPVEHLMSLRAMPNLFVVRPGDANETLHGWRLAMMRQSGPTAMVLSRQNLPVFPETDAHGKEGVMRGAYVFSDPDSEPRAILLATGSELSLAVEASEVLRQEGVPVRVVSMPCWEAFQEQPVAYRDSVLPPSIRARVAVEAGATLGWERWVGDQGSCVGIDRFGASAPGSVNYQNLGITVGAVAEAVRCVVSHLSQEASGSGA